MSAMIVACLRKMSTRLSNPVTYSLRLGDEELELNTLIGKTLSLEFTGEIYCIQCGRKTNKSFQQGHCFPCMRRINECDNCVLHPERCHVEEGTCPEGDWAHVQCHQRHVVYLANSSGLKVGITRYNHVPTRWIDQGAIAALPIVEVQNRRQAGLVEVALKAFANDKTNWRAMLKNDVLEIDLLAARNNLIAQAKSELDSVISAYDDGVINILPPQEVVSIHYPVDIYPVKIKSLSFDKTPAIRGQLQGIKGQYLYFEHGVLNIRKFGGYQVNVEYQ